MNLTIRRNGDKVWAGVEPTQTTSGYPQPSFMRYFYAHSFFYGRVACSHKIPFVGKLQTRLVARVQVPDHPLLNQRGNTIQLGVKIMNNQLTFNNISLNTINRDGQIWITSSELAQALDYADASGVTRIYNRYNDEFTEYMTRSVKLTDRLGKPQMMRIFSLRGCHLIAMFAKTKIAKEFRKWVLDILDHFSKPQIEEQPKAKDQIVVTEMKEATTNNKSRRFYIEISITDNLMGGTVYMKKVAETTNHMVTGFANDLGYRIFGLEMIGDAFAEIYKK
ncbi:MAG: BRO-N domain-containing protein [Wohlfahrtiimonas sp.]